MEKSKNQANPYLINAWAAFNSRSIWESHLQQKLHHIGVHQTLDALSIHVSDEVTSPQPGLMSRTAVFNALDQRQHIKAHLNRSHQ